LEQQTLERLYDACANQMFAYALSITGQGEAAEDALQEAFAGLLRLETEPRCLRAYAFRCVRNAAIDGRRRRRPTAALNEESLFDDRPGPRAHAMNGQANRLAMEALRALGDDERETIVMHLFSDLTFREIGELRDAPLGTVTSWYRRGLEKMRRQMEEHR
jgi:RNA polymerase sigma-70 factor (ECF subfamily)